MLTAACTHQGRVRPNNEDSVFLPDGRENLKNVIIVADGMGGHNAGEIASRIAVEQAAGCLDVLLKDPDNANSPLRLVHRSICVANEAVYGFAQRYKKFAGMGTTLTMAMLLPDKVVFGHVGDSRAYMFHCREDVFEPVTRDHSLVAELIYAGTLTEEEAERYPYRNVITRALGAARRVDVDVCTLPWEPGDMVLLCTDGLTQMLKDDILHGYCAAFRREQHKLEDLSVQMVTEALDCGGYDNVTVALAFNTGNEERREASHGKDDAEKDTE